MKILEFKKLNSDASVFIYRQDNEIIIIVVYVNNTLFIGKNKVLVIKIKNDFIYCQKYQDLGDAKEFLRIKLCQEKYKIYIDQVPYLEKVLRKFNLASTYTISTLLLKKYQLLSHNSFVNAKLYLRYQAVIRSLLYIILEIYLDIAYAIIYLSQFCMNLLKKYLNKTLYICRYFASTKNYLLVYDSNKGQGIKGYTDTDWTLNPIT